jgi:hypothetical protein
MSDSSLGGHTRYMPCIFKLIMDVLFGPEEQIAYVTVTSR